VRCTRTDFDSSAQQQKNKKNKCFGSGDVGCKYSSKSQLPLGKLKAEQAIAERDIYISGENLKGRKGWRE
jgi:hypothetical protein